MQAQVRLFAMTKELVGCDTVEIELEAGATVADLRRTLLQQWPALEVLANHLQFAVEAELADDTTPIPPQAEVACIPPVSGG